MPFAPRQGDRARAAAAPARAASGTARGRGAFEDGGARRPRGRRQKSRWTRARTWTVSSLVFVRIALTGLLTKAAFCAGNRLRSSTRPAVTPYWV